MTTRSDRELPAIDVTEAEIRQLIAPVYAGTGALQVALLPGKVNTCFHVRTEDVSFKLRLIAGDLNAQVKEANLALRYDTQLPIASNLHFQLTSTASRGFPFAIDSWIEGQTLDEVLLRSPELAEPAGRAVGQLVAGFQSIEMPDSGFLSPQLAVAPKFRMNQLGYTEYLGGLMQASHAGQRLAQLQHQLYSFVRQHAGLMDSIPSRSNLVHGSFQAENILLRTTADGLIVAGVLEWGRAMAWTSWFDLALVSGIGHGQAATFESGLLAGFSEAGGLLPTNWTMVKNLMRLLSACDTLSRPVLPAHWSYKAVQVVSSILSA